MSEWPCGLKEKIAEWKSWDKNEKTVSEINGLIDNNAAQELCKRLLDRLSFGTAGLRGKMEAGYNAMNDLVIIQTTQGLLKYLEENEEKRLKENGIIFGYDGRHNSKRFAELSASIFLHKNYKVYLFSDVVPTPLVAYGVRKWKCVAGVIVTASHNPKDDNGYKVYWTNGAQIISPIDKGIQKKILENLEPWSTSWDTTILKQGNPLLIDPLKETFESYVKDIGSNVSDEQKKIIKTANVKFTYTALHGVGYKCIEQLFRSVGLSLVPVEEQRDPNPDFPTVRFPNPEEGKSCLDLSFKKADAIGSKIVLANDPDADRLAVAEKNDDNGTWTIFNGNELGALLGWWILQCYRKRFPGKDLTNCYMMASTVSSKILRTISRQEMFNFEETLTGFKWMGNRTFELENKGKEVIFAFEEAIGFMCDHHVLDKDGISAALVMATLVSHLYTNGKTLAQKLDEIYDTYGYHVTHNSYFICHEADKIKSIFYRLRNFEGPDSYPKSILEGKYRITGVRDLTTGYDSDQPYKKAILPVSKSSQMITFSFENGFVATLRTSGTEPKIKYYTELCAPPTEKNRKELHDVLDEMVQALVAEFLQPKMYGLIPRPT